MSETPNVPAGQTDAPKGYLSIRRDIRFVPQNSASEWQCIVEDPVAKKFYRIGRIEYLVASALDGKHDLAKLHLLLAKANPNVEVDSSAIEQTIKWLMGTGLAVMTQPPQNKEQEHGLTPAAAATAQPSATNANAGSKPSKPKGINIPIDPFSFRFPILNGDVIEGFAKNLRWLCSPVCLVAGLVLMMIAAMKFTSNMSFYTTLGAKLFVPEAALWWAAAWFVLKFVHELGHATFCVAEGAKVRGAGVAFFYLAPMPFIDTTDMWRLPTRKSRALCAAGGMWFELLLACAALLLCGWFENQTLQYFCIALATLGTFTTVAFNANPLVRFDGYFILSDALNRPTLWSDGQNAWKSVFGGRKLFLSTAISLHGLPLVLYGAGCFFNRIVMMIGLAWGTWHTWRGIGLCLIGFAAYLWFINPYIKKQRTLAAAGQPAFRIPSILSLAKAAMCIGSIACLSYFVPSPWQPQVPGLLTHGDPVMVRPAGEGFITRVLVEDNQNVDVGTPIVELQNSALQLSVATTRLQLESSKEKCLVLRAQSKIAEMQAEQAKVESLAAQLDQLQIQSQQMTIKASARGRFISRQLSRQIGQFIKTGEIVGAIIPSERVEVACTISQQDIESYRASIDQHVYVHLQGIGRVQGTIKKVEPRGSNVLASPVLAAKYGGPIAVHFVTKEKDDSKDNLRTNTSRFVATVELDNLNAELLQGNSMLAGQLCRVELSQSQLTIANAIDRWFKAFVEWVKPPHVDEIS